MFERIERKNRLYTIELQGLDPLPYGSRVQKAGMAKSLSFDEQSAHTESSPIANSDKDIIPNSQAESQGANSKQAKIRQNFTGS